MYIDRRNVFARRSRFVRPIVATEGGNQVSSSIYSLCQSMAAWSASTPKTGGLLTINGENLGYYDYCIKDGNQTITSFTNNDWFTTNSDDSAFIVVKGNLTINSGQTLIPTNRKLFTVIYVTGNLSISGGISMTGRGANHRGDGVSGRATTAAAIRLANGTFSGVTNPQVPAAGGAGAAGVRRTTRGNLNGGAGTAGTDGGTGGGGSGAIRLAVSGDGTSGAGAAGTSFSGGASGASAYGNGVAGSGQSNGGKGGSDIATRANPGTGNPGGDETGGTGVRVGTGGVLVIFVLGALSGGGVIEAKGVRGAQDVADGNYTGSGGSGGGSVTVFYGSDSSTITPSAAGGAGGASGGAAAGVTGGAGGNGTARKLSLV